MGFHAICRCDFFGKKDAMRLPFKMIDESLCSGVASGEACGSTCPGAQALGAQQHTLCSHLNVFLSRNLDQSMLKNAYFLVKHCKIVSVSGASPPNPRLPSAARGSAHIPPRCYSRLLLQLCRVRF